MVNAEMAFSKGNIEVDDSIGGTSLVENTFSEEDLHLEIPVKNSSGSYITDAPCSMELKSSETKKKKKKKRQKKLQNNLGKFETDASSINNDSIERDLCLESTVDANKKTDINCEVDIDRKLDLKFEVDVNTKMSLKSKADIDPKTDVGPSELIRSQKKRRKKLKQNKDAGTINDQDHASLKTKESGLMRSGSIEKDFCLESEVDSSTKTDLKSEVDVSDMKDLRPSELSCLMKRKRKKKQKQRDNAGVINDVDHNLLEADQSDQTKSSSIVKDSCPASQVDTNAKTELKSEGDISVKTELKSEDDVSTKADFRPELSCSQKKRRKKQKQKHSALLTNDEDQVPVEVKELDLTTNSSIPCLVSEVNVNAKINSKSEVDISTVTDLKPEINTKTDLISQVDINTKTESRPSDLSCSKKKRKKKTQEQDHHAVVNNDKDHAPLKDEELDLMKMEENTMIANEGIVLPSSASATLMKKCENNHKDALVSTEEEDIKSYQRKEESKTLSRKTKKLFESLENSAESIMVTGKMSLDHSNKVQPGDSKLEEIHAGEGDTSMKVVENVSMENTLSECSNGDFACNGSEEMINGEGSNQTQVLCVSPKHSCIGHSNKKLLILDINGLLVDIVPYVPHGYRIDIVISRKSVFKRPFCDDFLKFCFEKFNVGIWSSRNKKNVEMAVDFLLRDFKNKLLFCWDQSHCTDTGFTTVENREKPLVLKELKKLWENVDSDLPWSKGDYDESNTLLLDDSPYKALRNPMHNAIFPHSYCFREVGDSSLGPGGDLRVYLERLAEAPNVQEFVAQNPFGQRPITESNPSWGFYSKIIGTDSRESEGVATNSITC